MWRETWIDGQLVIITDISIHSLRVERDVVRSPKSSYGDDFNPLSPCGERPKKNCLKKSQTLEFQSTLSVWRETVTFYSCFETQRYFNPLSPCGERLIINSIVDSIVTISIHSLRVERDHKCIDLCLYVLGFQSTLSVWRETECPSVVTCLCV